MVFLFGEVVIHAVRGTERILAEMEGFAITALCAVLGLCAKAAEDRLDEQGQVEPNGPQSWARLSENRRTLGPDHEKPVFRYYSWLRELSLKTFFGTQ